MPELPEIHALAADLSTRLEARVVDRVDVVSFAALKTYEPSASALAGGLVGRVAHHGKFLDIPIGELHLVIHLARAGWVSWRENAPAVSRRPGATAVAARMVLDDGSGINVTEAGTKKRLALYVVRDPLDIQAIAQLGVDPLGPRFTPELFASILARSGRAHIKGVLRNQSLIAGVGNAYSDEILHAAKMSPFKPASMSVGDANQLFLAIVEVLKSAIARSDGLTASDLKREKKLGLRVHGKTGEACPVCADTIRQVTFADSTLQYCPTCQTGGKVLADRVLSRLLR